MLTKSLTASTGVSVLSGVSVGRNPVEGAGVLQGLLLPPPVIFPVGVRQGGLRRRLVSFLPAGDAGVWR